VAGYSREDLERDLFMLDEVRHLARVSLLDGAVNAFELKQMLDNIDAEERRLTVKYRMICRGAAENAKERRQNSLREFKSAHANHLSRQILTRKGPDITGR